MDIIDADIPDVKIISARKHGDERGFFSETFRDSVLRDAGVNHGWVQDNHARSERTGTLRGLHFQAPPFAQAKLLRVSHGAVLDVVVDIRLGSPTFGQHVAVELSAANWKQIYVPVGFAHGYCTLSPDTEVLYKVSQYYSPQHEGGLKWNDPALSISWPFDASATSLNQRDQEFPSLAELTSPFNHEVAN